MVVLRSSKLGAAGSRETPLWLKPASEENSEAVVVEFEVADARSAVHSVHEVVGDSAVVVIEPIGPFRCVCSKVGAESTSRVEDCTLENLSWRESCKIG